MTDTTTQRDELEDKYYIQRKQSPYLGNSPFWWAKDGKGYTAYILGAERFNKSEAIKMVTEDSEKWAMFKCADVDKRLHLVFDIQDKSRLGTDAPCGWPAGYAMPPLDVEIMKAAITNMQSKVSELEAKIAELQKDADRYNFLKRKVFYDENGVYLSSGIWSALDKHNSSNESEKYIDAAIADEGEK